MYSEDKLKLTPQHVLINGQRLLLLTGNTVSLIVHILFFYNLKLIQVTTMVLLGFSLTVKAATLIFISWRGSAISSAKEGKSGFVYNL